MSQRASLLKLSTQLSNKLAKLNTNDSPELREEINQLLVTFEKNANNQRFKDELYRHKQDFKRITSHYDAIIARNQLLNESFQDDEAEQHYSTTNESAYLDERVRVQNQHSIMDQLLTQVAETRDEMLRQRKVLDGLAGRMEGIILKMPGLNVLLTKIDARHRRQAIVLTTSVIIFEETGGPEVLKYKTDYPVPSISDDEILVKNKYSGINFIEYYFREGVYPISLPHIPGSEASGEVVAVGRNIKDYKVGDKIAYLGFDNFAQFTKVNPTYVHVVNLGGDATDEQLKLYAAVLAQGLTGVVFIKDAYDVQKDDYILVTAAAGGVGLILVQLLSKLKKAHVVAVASSDDKLAKAKDNGAEYLLNSSKLSYDEIADEVLKLTNGNGVQCVFDSIGKDAIDMSIKVAAKKGTIVNYGIASGEIESFEISRLQAKNIKLVKPNLFTYIEEQPVFDHYTKSLFGLIDSKLLNVDISKVYPLKDYKEAAMAMEARKTTGKLVLQIPQ
ncbi:hypothetical protein JL09_g3503 [Pichia kudriavzevii]|uniref:Enoyl reductase (ER) domain-containing protein n=1 Tax=Pichia kudriavzevii TaxID=4909 RepID=A0A099NX15_PICKU|nr:hypothetical protein JL09_g3503 [Pichia kudriavzevii]